MTVIGFGVRIALCAVVRERHAYTLYEDITVNRILLRQIARLLDYPVAKLRSGYSKLL